MALPPDLQTLTDQYDAIETDTRLLVSGMDERTGAWRKSPDQWSVAICLDHLAIANRVYLQSMAGPVSNARAVGHLRRSAVKPGFFGGLFARNMEPPVARMFRIKAPKKIVPRPEVALADGVAVFLSAHQEVRDFISTNADLDLSSIHFPNPFVRGVRFSVASGLYIIAAHERRHLWQARQIKARADREPGR